jgi:hypothetical protein
MSLKDYLRNLSLRFGMVKVMKISETALRTGSLENSISRFGIVPRRGIFKRLDYQNLQSPAKHATKFSGFNPPQCKGAYRKGKETIYWVKNFLTLTRGKTI